MTDNDCILPSVQIDGWSADGSACLTPASSAESVSSARKLVQTLLEDAQLAALSLLLSTGAETCSEIAHCVRIARGQLHPRVESGQFYLHRQWRIRHEHMHADNQRLALMVHNTSSTALHDAFSDVYDSGKIEASIYRIIGHARAKGVQALLQLPHLG